MNVFDLKTSTAYPLGEREKNVLYRGKGFKVRIVELLPEGEIPPCDMAQHVVFTVVSGTVDISVNDEIVHAQPSHCVVIHPATVAMKSASGARVMAVQIDDVAHSDAKGGK